MNKIATIIIALATTATLAVPAAFAGGRGKHAVAPAQKAQKMLQKFDSNRDGVLDASELESMIQMRQHRRANKMAAFDINGDGTIDASERQAAQADRADRRYDRMLQRHDQNGDGMLSRSEITPPADRPGMAARIQEMFRVADRNNNGTVTREEFRAAMPALKAAKQSADRAGDYGVMRAPDGHR